MRLPRLRFTVRRMMFAVAFAAMLMGTARAGWHSWYCWKMAEAIAQVKSMQTWRCGMIDNTPEEERAWAESCEKRSAHYAGLEAKYRRAAWKPWESIPPDPRHPWLSEW